MAKRRDLFDPTDPADLQPEQRLTEIAAILAAGVIRMRERRGCEASGGPPLPRPHPLRRITEKPDGPYADRPGAHGPGTKLCDPIKGHWRLPGQARAGETLPHHREAERPHPCRRFLRNPAGLALRFPAEVALMASVVNAL